MRRATLLAKLGPQDREISIHALLAESDTFATVTTPQLWNFYPRSPCGERLGIKMRRFVHDISIHALLAESDHLSYSSNNVSITISIHALLAESDPPLPCRAEYPTHFYPRSPCGERQLRVLPFAVPTQISIHALLAESDAHHHGAPRRAHVISIHALLAESDTCTPVRTIADAISIHALLAESDGASPAAAPRERADFYPRSPCGEPRGRNPSAHYTISIHALLAESDYDNWHKIAQAKISIHALLAESDDTLVPALADPAAFLSTLSLRRATWLPS